jgi:hypothetical protein
MVCDPLFCSLPTWTDAEWDSLLDIVGEGKLVVVVIIIREESLNRGFKE